MKTTTLLLACKEESKSTLGFQPTTWRIVAANSTYQLHRAVRSIYGAEILWNNADSALQRELQFTGVVLQKNVLDTKRMKLPDRPDPQNAHNERQHIPRARCSQVSTTGFQS